MGVADWVVQGCQGWQTQMRVILALAPPSDAKYGEKFYIAGHSISANSNFQQGNAG